MDQNNNQAMNNHPDAGAKTFTQEQLNAIVGERLAKEKSKADAALAERERQFAEREKQLANREALFELKDQLKEMGLPAELLPVLNVSDKKALDTALEALKTHIAEQTKNEMKGWKVLPNILEKGNGEYHLEEPIDKKLRKAMHLSE